MRILTPMAGLALICASAAQAQWTVGVDAHGFSDSNINQSADEPLADKALMARLTVSRHTELDDDSELAWSAALEDVRHARFAGLDEVAISGSLSWRGKWGLGAYAPWWRTTWTSSRQVFDSTERDAWVHEAGIELGRRLDPRWSTSVGARFTWQMARPQAEAEPGVSGDAFSGQAASLTGRIDWVAAPSWQLMLSGFLRRGDVAANSADNDRILAVAKAAAFDTVFGADRYAYRLTGTSAGWALDLSHALDERMQLRVGVQAQSTRAAAQQRYDKTLLTLAWSDSF